MRKGWLAATGNLPGWLIAVALWCVVVLGYIALQASQHGPGRKVRLDASLAEVIRYDLPVQLLRGYMSESADAADDYHLAVLEYYSQTGYGALSAASQEDRPTDPDAIELDAPRHLLAGAKKAHMRYTQRFVAPEDWTSDRPGHFKAFQAIARTCLLKADLLAKAGRSAEAEPLLKAVIVFGYHIEQERLRLHGTLTGLAIQKLAAKQLQELYERSNRTDEAQAAQRYVDLLRSIQDKVLQKARLTVARLRNASPPARELMWLIEHDRDHMWRIEAILTLGLAKLTAPVAVDRAAATKQLKSLLDDTDPVIRQAANTAWSITPEDLHKIR